MAILNSEHLFKQADRLVVPPPAGPPRQVDVRRAISSAYYGVFHATLTAAADHFVGAAKRGTHRYGLVYRSVQHGALRSLCEIATKQQPTARYVPHLPDGSFGPNISAFAAAALELQEKRHSADYDPLIRVKTSDARLAIGTARAALQRFNSATASEREAFLTLLLFAPR